MKKSLSSVSSPSVSDCIECATSMACPPMPANAEQALEVNDSPRTIFILSLPKGSNRYNKLSAGAAWTDKSRYDQYQPEGYRYVNYIVPRIGAGWSGTWAISRCPGDVTSSNVVQKSSSDISMFWYGLPVGASPSKIDSSQANTSDAVGLPGLLVPESQGGQSWYINFRTDDCEIDRLCQENPGTCNPLIPPIHNHWYGLDSYCQSANNVF